MIFFFFVAVALLSYILLNISTDLFLRLHIILYNHTIINSLTVPLQHRFHSHQIKYDYPELDPLHTHTIWTSATLQIIFFVYMHVWLHTVCL